MRHGCRSLAVLRRSACSAGRTVEPQAMETFTYSDNGVQRVACCADRESQKSGSPEYSVAGVMWCDVRWHGQNSGPISCIKPGRRNPVRIGYVETEVSDDAPRTTIITWLKSKP